MTLGINQALYKTIVLGQYTYIYKLFFRIDNSSRYLKYREFGHCEINT